MNTNEKYKLADLVVTHALKNGAKEVSVNVYDSHSNNIEIRDQKVDSLKESQRNGLSISLYVDKKFSSHSTNRLKESEVYKFVEEAIAATRFLSEDEFRVLPDPELYYKGGGTDLKVFDSNLDSVDTRTKINMASDALNEAYKKDERIISVSSYYNDNITNSVMVASNGFRGDSAKTNVGLSVTVSMNSKTGRPSDYWNENSIFMDNLKTTDIGKKALERTIRKMDPKKIASGRYTVIVENRVAANLLYPVQSALLASSLYQKQSFLIGKLNKPIASPLLSVYDDPQISSGQGSRWFDGEGLATVRRPIIEKGILKDYYIDNYYGRKLGMKPNSGSSSNVVFETGSRNLGEMVGSLKKGIMITGFIGGNANGSTGDFSYGIEGFYIENGNIVHPVNEMNISGNMNKFLFNLSEAGKDVVENEPVMIPSLIFENIDLSGI